MKKIVIATILLSTGLMMTGCGLFHKTNKGGKSSKANVEEPMLPHDREIISRPKDERSYSPDEIKQGVVKGDWSIQTVYGKSAVGEKAPFLKFVPAQKRVYGSNGCNVINAAYTYNPADSLLQFDKIASTMMECAMTGITDAEINQALEATRYYTWDVKGSEYFMYFFDKDRRQVLSLMHQNFDFLNGTWQVIAIADEKIDVPDMKLVIDVDEGKLHGNTGCNILNGRMEINMDEANSISFNAIGMTQMACPDMNYETALIVALEEASHARPVSPTEVLLFDNSGKQVLSLVRAASRN